MPLPASVPAWFCFFHVLSRPLPTALRPSRTRTRTRTHTLSLCNRRIDVLTLAHLSLAPDARPASEVFGWESQGVGPAHPEPITEPRLTSPLQILALRRAGGAPSEGISEGTDQEVGMRSRESPPTRQASWTGRHDVLLPSNGSVPACPSGCTTPHPAQGVVPPAAPPSP